jgi:hypothetical protein
MPEELPLALAGLGVCIGVFTAGQIIDRRLPNPLKPRLLPWRELILASGAGGLLLILYTLSLFRPPTY